MTIKSDLDHVVSEFMDLPVFLIGAALANPITVKRAMLVKEILIFTLFEIQGKL
jgi:hypothetical protein